MTVDPGRAGPDPALRGDGVGTPRSEPAARAQLHLILDWARFPHDLVGAAARALEGGVDWVQIRARTVSAADLYALAREIAPRCRERGAGLLINDRVDVALAVGADGVHLAAASLAPAVVRALVGPRRIIGCSVHAVGDASAAARDGADYVTFGHVFATASHPGVPPRGTAALRRVVEAVARPVLAVGGITPDRVGALAATGCAGIAVVGAILGAPDPAEAAREFRRALAGWPRPHRPFPAGPARGPAPQPAVRAGEDPRG